MEQNSLPTKYHIRHENDHTDDRRFFLVLVILGVYLFGQTLIGHAMQSVENQPDHGPSASKILSKIIMDFSCLLLTIYIILYKSKSVDSLRQMFSVPTRWYSRYPIFALAATTLFFQVALLHSFVSEASLYEEACGVSADGRQFFMILVILGFFSLCVIGPTLEEILFRGIMFEYINKEIGPFFAIITTTVIFAALHINNENFLALAATGLIFGILRWLTGSILTPTLLHGLINTFEYVIILHHKSCHIA